MLTLYLTCLLVGGVFVGLSVFSGLDKDADIAVDKEFDFDADAAADFDADADCDVAGHLTVDDVHVDFDADVGVEHATLAEASHGADQRQRPRRRKRRWLPFMSFRFWTFGSAFFGLTGATLTWLSLSVEPMIVVVSGALGLGIGTAASAIVRALRRPVGVSHVSAADYRGAVGELLLPLKPEGVSKVRIRMGGGVQEIVAVSTDGQALPKGASVVVLSVDDEGRARVTPEEQLFSLEES